MHTIENHISVSALAAKLALEKLHSATLYTDMTQPILAYSHSLSKLMTEYAEQDASVAGILRDLIFVALEHETAKRNEPSGPYMTAKTKIQPLSFVLPGGDEEADAETVALKTLEAARIIENRSNASLKKACAEPAAREISAVIDLEALTRISARRANHLKQIVDEINSNTYWRKPAPVNWTCLQCGEVIKDHSAFDECPCCKGGRECAAAQ